MLRRSMLTLVLAACGTVVLAEHADAQSWRFQFHSGGWPDHSDRVRTHNPHHHTQPSTPDLATLDRYSDKLSKIVQHLHEDAHHLSQDYHHSASIEHYVSELDHLKRHMHEVLHQASRHRAYSTMLERHIKQDLQRVKQLLHELDDELAHQSIDGARASDRRTIKHMREVILLEAHPWVQLMENELDGDAPHGRLGSHAGTDIDPRRRGDRRVVAQPRFEHRAPQRRSGFRFSF